MSRLFDSKEHCMRRTLLAYYKQNRRRNCSKIEALHLAKAKILRIQTTYVVMEASEWRADPYVVGQQAMLLTVEYLDILRAVEHGKTMLMLYPEVDLQSLTDHVHGIFNRVNRYDIESELRKHFYL